MIIWTRLGFLVLVIGFGCLLLTQMTIDGMMDDRHYYLNHGWPKLLGCSIAAAITWIVGRKLNSHRPANASVFERGDGHSLFFIPMELWAVLFVLLGVLFLLTE